MRFTEKLDKILENISKSLNTRTKIYSSKYITITVIYVQGSPYGVIPAGYNFWVDFLDVEQINFFYRLIPYKVIEVRNGFEEDVAAIIDWLYSKKKGELYEK
jgi:hypothetical protein